MLSVLNEKQLTEWPNEKILSENYIKQSERLHEQFLFHT